MKKKLLSLLLALMLLMSMAVPALATEDHSNQVHLIFTTSNVESTNDPDDPDDISYTWTGTGYVLYDAGWITLSSDLMTSTNRAKYVPSDVSTFAGQSFINLMDVIMTQKTSQGITTTWDYNATTYGSPNGAYITLACTLPPAVDYEEVGSSTVNMYGSGWYIAVKLPGSNTITYPEYYGSSIQAVGGSILYVDYGYYEYYNVDIS